MHLITVNLQDSTKKVCGHYKISFTNPNLSTGWDLPYQYTVDLLCLEFHRSLTPHTPEVLSEVSTWLDEAWSRALATHPDKAFARYICNGLCSGFRVGFRLLFNQPQLTCRHDQLNGTYRSSETTCRLRVGCSGYFPPPKAYPSST